jgi:hypothetical protein
MSLLASGLQSCTAGIRNLVLTGSGSSEYAGDCVRLALQKQLSVNTLAIGGGVLLTHGLKALPLGPGLVVSLAGQDSPERGRAGCFGLDPIYVTGDAPARAAIATSFETPTCVCHHCQNQRPQPVMTSGFQSTRQQVSPKNRMSRVSLPPRQEIVRELLQDHFGTYAGGSLEFLACGIFGDGRTKVAAREAVEDGDAGQSWNCV